MKLAKIACVHYSKAMRLPFRKSPSQQSNHEIGFEPEDKPTPLAGKFLLVLMSFLLLFLGFRGLEDVENIVSKPQPLSYCVSGYGTSYQDTYRDKLAYPPEYLDYTDSYSQGRQSCIFSAYERKYNVPELYERLQQVQKSQEEIYKQRNELQTTLDSIRQAKQDAQRNYDLTLQERQANQPVRSGNAERLVTQIQSLAAEEQQVQGQLQQISSQVNQAEATIKATRQPLEEAVKKAQKDYEHANAIFRLKVFLIQAILVFPLFIFFLKLYFRLKAKDSPHTIIATFLVGVSGIFAAGITMQYIWSLFLADLLEEVFAFLRNVPLFRTLLYYVGMLLVIAVFGGAVYLLQKKIFDPKRVQLRRLRSHKCPHCDFPVDFAKAYCPACGNQITEKCPNCQAARYILMKFCPHCGKTVGTAS